jgi:metallo-beta-lactamase class B
VRGELCGGLGLNAIQNARQVELYIDSVEKLDRMASSGTRPVEVHLTTHPFATGMMEQRDVIARRRAGEPHPLVDPSALHALLEALESDAKERLVSERAKAQK